MLYYVVLHSSYYPVVYCFSEIKSMGIKWKGGKVCEKYHRQVKDCDPKPLMEVKISKKF